MNKVEVVRRLAELVSQYRKVSKVQIKTNSNVVVTENQKLLRKIHFADQSAKHHLAKEANVKGRLRTREAELETFQDTRIQRSSNAMDGTVQHFSRENALKKRKIRDLGEITHTCYVQFVIYNPFTTGCLL